MKSMPIDRTSEYAALRQRPTLKKLKDIEDLRLLAQIRVYGETFQILNWHISECRCVLLDIRDIYCSIFSKCF